MRSTRSTAARDLFAVPAEDLGKALAFLLIRPVCGVDERVVGLQDHSRRRVPDFGRNELRFLPQMRELLMYVRRRAFWASPSLGSTRARASTRGQPRWSQLR